MENVLQRLTNLEEENRALREENRALSEEVSTLKEALREASRRRPTNITCPPSKRPRTSLLANFEANDEEEDLPTGPELQAEDPQGKMPFPISSDATIT